MDVIIFLDFINLLKVWKKYKYFLVILKLKYMILLILKYIIVFIIYIERLKF